MVTQTLNECKVTRKKSALASGQAAADLATGNLTNSPEGTRASKVTTSNIQGAAVNPGDLIVTSQPIEVRNQAQPPQEEVATQPPISPKTRVFESLRGLLGGGVQEQDNNAESRETPFTQLKRPKALRAIEKSLQGNRSEVISSNTVEAFIARATADDLSKDLQAVKEAVIALTNNQSFPLTEESLEIGTIEAIGNLAIKELDESERAAYLLTEGHKTLDKSTRTIQSEAIKLSTKPESSLSRLQSAFIERHPTTGFTKAYKSASNDPEVRQELTTKFFVNLAKHLVTPPRGAKTEYSNNGRELSNRGVELVQNLTTTAYLQQVLPEGKLRNISMMKSPSIAGMRVKPLEANLIAPGKAADGSEALMFDESGRPLFTSNTNTRFDLPYPANSRSLDFIASLEGDLSEVTDNIDKLVARIADARSALSRRPGVEILVATPQEGQGKSGDLGDTPFLTRADTMLMASYGTTFGDKQEELNIPLSDLSLISNKGKRQLYKLSDVRDSEDGNDIIFTYSKGDSKGVPITSVIPKKTFADKDFRSLMESPELHGNIKVGRSLYSTIPNYEELGLQLSAKQATTNMRGGVEGRRLHSEIVSYIQGSEGSPEVTNTLRGLVNQSQIPNLDDKGREIPARKEDKSESPLTTLMRGTDKAVNEGDDEEVTKQILSVIKDTFIKYTGTLNKTSNTIIFNEKTSAISYEQDTKKILNNPKIKEERIRFVGGSDRGDGSISDPVLIYSFTLEDKPYSYSIRVAKISDRAPHTIIETGKYFPSSGNAQPTTLQESFDFLLEISYKEFVELLL